MSRDQWWALSFLAASVVMAVVQMMYPLVPPEAGWPIVAVGSLASVTMFVKGARRRDSPASTSQIGPRRLEAQGIHNRIIDLDIAMESAKDSLTDTEEWRHNPEIRETLDKLQIELNALGYLVHSSEYDRWAEAFIDIRSRELQFHMRLSELNAGEWGRARVNAKLRGFVGRVRG